MYLEDLKNSWISLGRSDPLWAILTDSQKKHGKWNKENFFKTGDEEIKSVMQYIEQLEINITRRKSLDFGCGVGRLTQALAQYFDEVVGVDISLSMIDLANKYNMYKDKCKYCLNTTFDLRMFENNCFDFIYSNIVLQHIQPKYSIEYIKEFLRTLSPGGLLIFQLPGKKLPGKSMRALLRRIIPIPDFWVYTCKRKIFGAVIEMYYIEQENILALLKNNGAKIIDIVQDNSLTAAEGFLSYRYCVTKD